MIPDEAVEAAAKAMLVAGNKIGGWDALPTFMQENYMRDARAALEAAAPHMLKDLRELVEDMEAQQWTEVGTIPGMAALIRSSARGLL